MAQLERQRQESGGALPARIENDARDRDVGTHDVGEHEKEELERHGGAARAAVRRLERREDAAAGKSERAPSRMCAASKLRFSSSQAAASASERIG